MSHSQDVQKRKRPKEICLPTEMSHLKKGHKIVFKLRALFTPPYCFPINTLSHSTYSVSFSGSLVFFQFQKQTLKSPTQFRESVPYMLSLIHITASLASKVSFGFPISALIEFNQASLE